MTILIHRQRLPRPAVHVRVLSRPSWLTVGLFGVALGLATVALLGPLVFGVVDYRVSETLRNQTIGLDLVSLAVVAPLALAAAYLVGRGRAVGFALALGIGAYTAYMFVQYVLGPDYAHHAGNNERLFPLALALIVAGWSVALAAWNQLDVDAVPLSPRRARLLSRIVLPVLALAAFGRYLPALVDWTSASPEDKTYLAGPSFAWTIALLDLGIFLPLAASACFGLARGRRWAKKALYAVVTWFGLVGPAVAAMAVTMAVNDDPAGSTGNAFVLSVLGAAFLILAVVVYWPLVKGAAAGRGRFEATRCLSRHRRAVLAAVTLIVGVGALFGGWGLLADAEGLGAKQSWLDGSPFPNYIVPGLILLVVIGGGMLATTVVAIAGSRFAAAAAVVMAGVLAVWGVVETATIGYQGAGQLLLLALFVVAPAALLVTLGLGSGGRHGR